MQLFARSKSSKRRRTPDADAANRWDSSDPERAPPPLPLNPGTGTPSTSPVRANTSATVAAAAQALVERARENLSAHYVTNPLPERLADKSPTRTPQHKRLQSLQSPGLRELRSLTNVPLESRVSRPVTPVSSSSSSSQDHISPASSRSATPTPTPRAPEIKDASPQKDLRRPASHPLLLENTPPSGKRTSPDTFSTPDVFAPLAETTNSSTPRTLQNFESLHSQMMNLTSIANAVQKEMLALSRRSKDNATDLMVLKEVTNKRDEDIRDSLRELTTSQRLLEARHVQNTPKASARENLRPSSVAGIRSPTPDETPSDSLPRTANSMPKLLASTSFQQSSESFGTSSPVSSSREIAAHKTMLESIIRDMGTKNGQDRLLESLTRLVERSGKEATAGIRNVIELVESLRDQPNNALIMHPSSHRSASIESSRDVDFQHALARRGESCAPRDSAPGASQSPGVNADVMKVLQKIKDSVTQSGGMTGEVKSLIKELRGEVLGMGRELGRKLETASKQDKHSARESMSRKELADIIEENLADLRVQMESIIQTRRRDSTASTLSRNTVDSAEVYAVVKQQLAERGFDTSQPMSNQQQPGLDADAILTAVKEAYEAYKPEVEVQQFGLERDEILQCLREGLEDYQASKPQADAIGIGREDILEAVQEAMQAFHPPQPSTSAAEIKEEVMQAVRDSLEDFKNSSKPLSASRGPEVNRHEVLEAVREGFGIFRKEGAREIEISPDDLHQAVANGLNSMDNPFGQYGDQVITSLHEIVDGMRVEFKQYSEANGRDTEQVLDALKDGMESLRAEIESYVDRAQDVTGRDEIISTLHHELDGLRSSFDTFAGRAGQRDSVSERSELASFIKAEFENLQEVVAAHSGSSSSRARGFEEPGEEQLEALKEEFEQLREAILSGAAAHKDELLDHITESMQRLPDHMNGLSRGLDNSEDVVTAVREELTAIRDSLSAPALYQGNSSSNPNEIIDAIRDSMNGIRAQLSAEQTESSNETLGVIREELDSFRAAIGGSLMLNTPGADKQAIIDAVQEGLESIDLSESSREGVASVKVELESLKHSLANAMVQSNNAADTEQIVDAVRAAMDDLKASMAGQVTLGGSANAVANEEALENIISNLSNLRTDVTKLHDKPVDMTVSYEILDTLKDGLSSIRFDLDRLKAGNEEVVLASSQQRVAPDEDQTSGALNKSDLQRVEVLLAQLQIKVEAMDQNMQSQPEVSMPNAATKSDLESVEHAVRELQSMVAGLSDQERTTRNTEVSKEDIDAIETLLQNSKAKIDERVIPSLENAATRDQLDGIESALRLTTDTVESLSEKIKINDSGKEDIAAVALLVHEATAAINEMKDRLGNAKLGDHATRGDFDNLETLCGNIKARIEDLPAEAPSKADIEELNELMADMRDSHNALRERYEGDIGITAKAFDDRKLEADRICEQIEDLRGFMEETRDHLKSRMKRGNEDVRALDDILQTIEEKIDDVPNHVPTPTVELEEIKEALHAEFEKAHSAMEDLRLGHDANSSVIVDKYEEHKTSIIADIVQKLDQRFNEIMSSHEEQKTIIGDTASSMTAKASQQDDLLAGTRAMADELKVSIDAFGASMTGLGPAVEEATQKMTEDSRTVFTKVEEMQSRIDEASVDSKTDQQVTRDEIAKALAGIDSLQSQAAMAHPEVMTALKALAEVVEQQFEHVKTSQDRFDKSSDGIKAHFDEGLRSIPLPQLDAPPQSTQGRFDDSAIHQKLEELLSRGSPYDDSQVHDKLDKLLGSTTSTGNATEQLQRLEDVHQQVMATASEVSAFIASQTKLITAENENKAKEADQAALDLNRCLHEKDVVQSDISSMKASKDSLAAEIASLKAEQEKLTSQKLHLSADVSSLETALRIRREELHMMDQRADALERRIIEGVMDHSRALLIAKAPRNPANMNLKRVASNRSTATASTATPSSVLNSGIDMAIKARTNRAKRAPTNPSARRIASLNQINNNVPAGGKNLASHTSRGTGLIDLKRSQSVKNPAMRKASWNPQEHGSLGGFDKENDVVSEEDEAGSDGEQALQPGQDGSSKMRSISYGGRSQTNSMSYFTGSDTDRRSSYGSTLRSALGPRSSLAASIHEEDEEDESDIEDDGASVRHTREEGDHESGEGEDEPVQPLQIEGLDVQAEQERVKNLKGLVLRGTDGYHTDSGLGSDLPTAALSAEMGDYFK